MTEVATAGATTAPAVPAITVGTAVRWDGATVQPWDTVAPSFVGIVAALDGDHADVDLVMIERVDRDGRGWVTHVRGISGTIVPGIDLADLAPVPPCDDCGAAAGTLGTACLSCYPA